MTVTEYCPRHRTPMGLHGCGVCRNQPVPMPQWFKDQLVALGLRDPDPDTPDTTES